MPTKKSLGEVYSPTPFGFNRVGNKLVRNPKEYRILNKICKLRKEGLSYQKVADYLNKRKHKTKKGKTFSRYSIFI